MPPPGGGGVLPYISHIGSRYEAKKGMVLQPFWSEIGYRKSLTISIRKGTWILIWDEYTS